MYGTPSDIFTDRNVTSHHATRVRYPALVWSSDAVPSSCRTASLSTGALRSPVAPAANAFPVGCTEPEPSLQRLRLREALQQNIVVNGAPAVVHSAISIPDAGDVALLHIEPTGGGALWLWNVDGGSVRSAQMSHWLAACRF